ncbi:MULTISPECIES: helix-turn-helix transcriptional regulator [unclassified Arthrobacter]|uniref:helix-turn-helix transcriptional regulator n=1 Tax=unclassified Arthrobacter TaxID=235627 RepID=UPI0021046795|nr:MULTISPECIES: helix-turn-helix transcriptional regulator [unclassified Arthrobacter]MCQ1947821.1 helix-turn-helix transcriptional regulator [Arthrobacter sp. zg-Y1116]MCQ1996275.1 helix-turn-helix transcriptional regulator [Arthrobacter sp. zg-Y1171]UWX82676.1 helix-turn-helix transcriptional regulator [Arthrobacter sp. zg-Y1171]
MGKSFGGKLRSARQERNLTQAQLGHGAFRPREISLLEAGRREPVPGAVSLLSDRLDSGAAPGRTGKQTALFLELSARQALDERDYGAACSLADAAAGAALAEGHPQSWWDMTYLAAHCLCTTHAYRDCIAKASLLARHPLAAEYPGLRAQAETLLATAYLGTGELGSAVTHARSAVARVQEARVGAAAFLDACGALVTALAEAGGLDEAWTYCRTLVLPLLETGVGRQIEGKARWAVGTVAFRRGDISTGLMHHRTAADLLEPGVDVELWARFNNATAAIRLGAGIHDRETLTCIEHAEAAMSVVGLHGPERLEADHSRGIWLDLNGDHARAVWMLSDVYAHRGELSPQDSGELALHLGLALARTGMPDAGSVYLADSEQRFRSAGAKDRAAHAAALAHEMAAG